MNKYIMIWWLQGQLIKRNLQKVWMMEAATKINENKLSESDLLDIKWIWEWTRVILADMWINSQAELLATDFDKVKPNLNKLSIKAIETFLNDTAI